MGGLIHNTDNVIRIIYDMNVNIILIRMCLFEFLRISEGIESKEGVQKYKGITSIPCSSMSLMARMLSSPPEYSAIHRLGIIYTNFNKKKIKSIPHYSREV